MPSPRTRFCPRAAKRFSSSTWFVSTLMNASTVLIVLGVSVAVGLLGGAAAIPTLHAEQADARSTSGFRELSTTRDFFDPLSTLMFPARVGDWNRTRLFEYSGPRYYAASYAVADSDGLVVATVYALPKAGSFATTLDRLFQSSLAEIANPALGRHVATVQSLTRYHSEGTSIQGKMAVVIFPGATLSHLQIWDYRECWLKWRITHTSRGTAQQLPDRIVELTKTLAPRGSISKERTPKR